MFTTFRGAQPQQKTRPRPQVRRACNACRSAKVRCDNSRPCRNCKNSQVECVSVGDGKDGLSSSSMSGRNRELVAATAEVNRLRRRVRELEANQMQVDESTRQETGDGNEDHGMILGNDHAEESGEWKTMSIDGLEYGQLSPDYFAKRLASYLKLDIHVRPPPMSQLVESISSESSDTLEECDALGRTQQDYFLDLFWMGTHVIFPVIDEDSFRELYASLWQANGNGTDDLDRREPHALIDIILALNIQFANGFLPTDGSGSEVEDSAFSGGCFYRRCERMLDRNAETPSVTDVQAHLFCALYLASAGCVNAAQSRLKLTEHVLSTLDAETKSSASMQTLRQCIYVLDTRLSMATGRLNLASPSPGFYPTSSENPTFTPTTLLDQMVRLSETVLDVANSFLREYTQQNPMNADFHAQGNASTRNACALLLRKQMAKLRQWADQVPPELVTPRSSPGPTFSTHRSSLRFRESDPLWLQRQQLVLECQYHDFSLSLFRLFVNFSPTPDRGTINSDNNCISCVNHAVVLTDIIAQTLRETDILTGWCQIQDWLQNAAFATAGFAAGYPVCPPTPSARKALATAAELFDGLSARSGRAAVMSGLARQFDVKIAELISKFKVGVNQRSQNVSASGVATRSGTGRKDGGQDNVAMSGDPPQLSDSSTLIDTPPLSWDGTSMSPGQVLWPQSPLSQTSWEQWFQDV